MSGDSVVNAEVVDVVANVDCVIELVRVMGLAVREEYEDEVSEGYVPARIMLAVALIPWVRKVAD